MINPSRITFRLRPTAAAAAVLVFALFAAVPVARAQAQKDDDLVDDAQPVIVNNGFAFADENFDMWVFGGGRNAQSARSRLDDQLTLQIDRLDRNCGISPEQRTKLMLAGHGDIKKFFDKVAEKKRKFDELKHDQNRIGEIFQEIQPLQLTFNQGIFNDNSIYQKTVKNTLNDEQRDKFRRMNDDLMLFRYRSRVALAVSMLDNSIGFSADQRRKFEKLLVDETKPPKKFSQYDTQVVFLQASHIPEAKVKAIFDDDQFRVLSRQFQQARNMEPFLRSNGFIGEEVPPANNAPTQVREMRKQRLVAPAPVVVPK